MLGLDNYSLTKLLCVLVTFAGVSFVTLAGQARRRGPSLDRSRSRAPAPHTLARCRHIHTLAPCRRGLVESGLLLRRVGLPHLSIACAAAQEASSSEGHTGWGDFLAVCSALLYAVYTAIIKVALPSDERVSMVRRKQRRSAIGCSASESIQHNPSSLEVE